ncbi:MAG: hypothetical protein KIS67_02085 [Verrucomicrobiae bacterium]|nr:hypothetical protein [Verrucomicrobiae bacterium]
MKKLLLTSLLLGSVWLYAPADVIKQWDFNTPPEEMDFLPGTGTLRPGIGGGFPAEAVGSVSNSFGQVSTVSGSSDPNSLDNTHWRLGSVGGLGGFPAQGTANKTAGAQFRVNTSGYNNIRVTWDQENSATASRYWRVQYTLNGTDWLDHDTVITANSIGSPDPDTSTPTWQLGLATDFSAVAGANNNPSFGFRFVSEFESTATGAGAEGYVANRPASTYGTAGTLWLDMITVTGDDLNPGNQWPQISAFADQTVLMDQSTAPLAFTISDAETPAGNLILSAGSSNPGLVNTFVFGGSGTDRTIVVTPEPAQQGSATITVRVTDAGGKMSETSFELTVTQPALSRIFAQATTWEEPVTIPFTVYNLPGNPATWLLAGNSSNPDAVQNSGIVFDGSGAERTVTITPVANAVGDTTITITVSSGGLEASTNFLFRLLPDFVLGFDFTDVPNEPVVSVAPTLVAEGLSASDIVRGPSLGVTSLTRGFSGNTWNSINNTNKSPTTASRDNAILTGDYFEFAITVEPGHVASLATLDVWMRRSAVNAAMNFEWQYSLDGFATPGVTIPPRGPIWESLGLSQNTFVYLGRTSGTAPGTVAPYAWVIQDVPGRPNLTDSVGDPIPTIDLADIPELQNLNGPKAVTFRLYGWGNNNTVDTNTTALGRVKGPHVRGTVLESSAQPPSLMVVREGNNVRISWPVSATGFTLERTPSLSPFNWQNVPHPVQVVGELNVVIVPISADSEFFRLHQ